MGQMVSTATLVLWAASLSKIVIEAGTNCFLLTKISHQEPALSGVEIWKKTASLTAVSPLPNGFVRVLKNKFEVVRRHRDWDEHGATMSHSSSFSYLWSMVWQWTMVPRDVELESQTFLKGFGVAFWMLLVIQISVWSDCRFAGRLLRAVIISWLSLKQHSSGTCWHLVSFLVPSFGLEIYIWIGLDSLRTSDSAAPFRGQGGKQGILEDDLERLVY